MSGSEYTVKSFPDRYSIPVQLELDFTHYHDFSAAYQVRWTVVKMYYEGWQQKSIAGYLKLSSRHVSRIIEVGIADHKF